MRPHRVFLGTCGTPPLFEAIVFIRPGAHVYRRSCTTNADLRCLKCLNAKSESSDCQVQYSYVPSYGGYICHWFHMYAESMRPIHNSTENHGNPYPILQHYMLCACVVFSSHPFWTSSSLDIPAGVTQEEDHTGFLIHLLSAACALIFMARRIHVD